mgnify:CR=1 FL=1
MTADRLVFGAFTVERRYDAALATLNITRATLSPDASHA